MTAETFSQYAKIMQEFRISRAKIGDVEIQIDQFFPPAVEPKSNEPIQHKVEELTSLLKLNDRDLVDQLFPIPDKEEIV